MRMRISMFPLPESERSVDRNLQILIQYLSFSQKNNEHWHRLSIISFLCLRSHIHIRQFCQQSILTSQCHRMSHCKIDFGSQICDFASLPQIFLHVNVLLIRIRPLLMVPLPQMDMAAGLLESHLFIKLYSFSDPWSSRVSMCVDTPVLLLLHCS